MDKNSPEWKSPWVWGPPGELVRMAKPPGNNTVDNPPGMNSQDLSHLQTLYNIYYRSGVGRKSYGSSEVRRCRLACPCTEQHEQPLLPLNSGSNHWWGCPWGILSTDTSRPSPQPIPTSENLSSLLQCRAASVEFLSQRHFYYHCLDKNSRRKLDMNFDIMILYAQVGFIIDLTSKTMKI